MMRSLIALLLLTLAAPALAQTTPAPAAAIADPALTARANELIGMVAGTGKFDAYFSPGFHAALPKEKWDAVVASMTGQMGKPLAIETIKPVTPFTAYLRIKFERGIVNAQIAIDPAAPHAVTGVLFTGVEVAGDTLDKLSADFRALPGASGFGIYALGDGAPTLVAGVEPENPRRSAPRSSCGCSANCRARSPLASANGPMSCRSARRRCRRA